MAEPVGFASILEQYQKIELNALKEDLKLIFPNQVITDDFAKSIRGEQKNHYIQYGIELSLFEAAENMKRIFLINR